MTKILTDYEIDKQKRKQKLVRNEFLYHGNSRVSREIPLISAINLYDEGQES